MSLTKAAEALNKILHKTERTNERSFRREENQSFRKTIPDQRPKEGKLVCCHPTDRGNEGTEFYASEEPKVSSYSCRLFDNRMDKYLDQCIRQNERNSRDDEPTTVSSSDETDSDKESQLTVSLSPNTSKDFFPLLKSILSGDNSTLRFSSLNSLNLNDFTPLDPNKYKTELCRTHQVHGYCRYGIRCNYAHGVAQLRVSFRHGKYKTRNCQSYHKTGFCRYGARCSFIHEAEEGILKCPIADREVLEALHYRPMSDFHHIATITWRMLEPSSCLPTELHLFTPSSCHSLLDTSVDRSITMDSSFEEVDQEGDQPDSLKTDPLKGSADQRPVEDKIPFSPEQKAIVPEEIPKIVKTACVPNPVNSETSKTLDVKETSSCPLRSGRNWNKSAVSSLNISPRRKEPLKEFIHISPRRRPPKTKHVFPRNDARVRGTSRIFPSPNDVRYGQVTTLNWNSTNPSAKKNIKSFTSNPRKSDVQRSSIIEVSFQGRNKTHLEEEKRYKPHYNGKNERIRGNRPSNSMWHLSQDDKPFSGSDSFKNFKLESFLQCVKSLEGKLNDSSRSSDTERSSVTSISDLGSLNQASIQSDTNSTRSKKDSTKYKTELCRSFQYNKHCEYNKFCLYAHGTEDLRSYPKHPLYRTKNCFSFHKKGFCLYGSRCQFLHDFP